MKHLNLRITDDIDTNDIPDEVAIHTHDNSSSDADKWLLYDQNGRTLPVFGWGEAIDYKNTEYLNYVLNDWMPNKYFDTYINEISKPLFYVHDNGNFLGFTSTSTCMGGATSITNQTLFDKCMWYSKDENSRTAWKTMLSAFKNKYPNKKILISSGPSPYDNYDDRMRTVKEIFAYADGYWSESINDDHVHWSNLPKSQISNDMRRKALKITMDTADWLAKNNKYFFVNLGMASVTLGDGPAEPTNAEVDYAWAYFNLMRQGDKQFFSRVTKDSAGSWVPEVYAEMDDELGRPLELATETSPNVWRRKFEKAIAYVNMSDSNVTITLPAGVNYTNAREEKVDSSFVLAPFRGLTVYGEEVRVPTSEDTEPPVLSKIVPSSNVNSVSGISFYTDEKAYCKYSKNSGDTYEKMTDIYQVPYGAVFHSFPLKQVPAGVNNYYIKCKDLKGNINNPSHVISFNLTYLGNVRLQTIGIPRGVVKEGKSYSPFGFYNFDWAPLGGPGYFNMYLMNSKVPNVKGLGIAHTNVGPDGYTSSDKFTPDIVNVYKANAPQGVSETSLRQSFYVRIEAVGSLKTVVGTSTPFTITREDGSF